MSASEDQKPEITSKSSLEILSELFSTFDAEPPVIVKLEKSEDSSKKHKKSKKKHKHKKHKKKSKRRKRSHSSSDSDSSGIDLTDILIKREVDNPIKAESKHKIKPDPDTAKLGKTKKPKTDDLNNHSESSSDDNDSDNDSSNAKESKYSSIFHVALQTLHEREKLKREQLLNSNEISDTKYKRKHHKDDVEINKKVKTEPLIDSSISDVKSIVNNEILQNNELSTNLSETDTQTSFNKLENNDHEYNISTIKENQKFKSSERSRSRNSKAEQKNESKRKISPIVFKNEDESGSRHRDSNKRVESDSKSKDRTRDCKDRDRDKDRHKKSNKNERSISRRRKDSDAKERHRSQRGDDDHSYGSKRDSSVRKSSRKRSHSGSRSIDRVTGFSQGNLVSTRLGNPFYVRQPGDRDTGDYYKNTRSPPIIRSHGKEDRWSLRERFRLESSSRSSSIPIDKKKLLEIARKNAVQMIKSGSLPEALKLGPQAQEKVLAAIRSGGKTVDELTDFCRTLSHKEELGELSSLSDGEQKSDAPESDAEQPFHHPFQLKERPQSITMNIKNSVPLPIKSTTERATELRLQFPVSSGQLHRKTESEWTPVESPAPQVEIASQVKSLLKKTDIAATSKSVVPPPPLPTPLTPLTPLNTPMSVSHTSTVIAPPPPPPPPTQPMFMASHTATIHPPLPASTSLPQPLVAPPLPPLPPMLPPPSPPAGLMAMDLDPPQQVYHQPVVVPPQPPIPGASEVRPQEPQVFPTPQQISEQQKLDVASIVAQRLTAMRKLQENPNDVQAISEIYKAQKEMNFWAECKQQFGQFTGSTGAQIMSQAELNSGYQAWARKDQLQTAAPVTGGMGMHLLQKMGWRPGEGLGKEKTGTLEPLLLEVKLDKKGVVAKEEIKGGRGAGRGNAAAKNAPSTVKQVVKVMQGKHPVSLLSEYASKKHMGAPDYSLCFECGPDHKKNFVFKVMLNGVEYKPNVACGNKKEAKALAATVCLQQIGMLPHVPSEQQGPM